jgi:hypothetical protein
MKGSHADLRSSSFLHSSLEHSAYQTTAIDGHCVVGAAQMIAANLPAEHGSIEFLCTRKVGRFQVAPYDFADQMLTVRGPGDRGRFK